MTFYFYHKMTHYTLNIDQKLLEDGAAIQASDAALMNEFIVKLAKVAIACISSSILFGTNLMTLGITAEYLHACSVWFLYAEVLLICILGFLVVWSIHEENDISNTLAIAFILVQGLYSGIIISKDSTYGILWGAMILLLLLAGSILAICKYNINIDKFCNYINESTESVIVILWLPFILAYIGDNAKHLVLAMAIFYLYCNTVCMILKKHQKDHHLKAGLDFYLHSVVKFAILQGALYAFF